MAGSRRKYGKDKLFTKIDHTATSGVVGDAEYQVHGENAIRVATTFTTSGTLTVQGRIENSDTWDALGTLTSGGDTDEFDIGSYDYIRYNFTVAAGSTGEIAASGFFKGSSGSAGATNTFSIMQTDAGTSPTADSATDTLTFTSSDASVTITGNSTTDTIDLVAAGGGITTPVTTIDNEIARWSGTAGDEIQGYTSGGPTINDTGGLTLNGGNDSIGSLADAVMYFDSAKKNGFTTNGTGNNLGIWNNNVRSAYITTSAINIENIQFRLSNGTVSNPFLAWAGMTNGGLWRNSTNDSLNMAINGVNSMEWDDNYVDAATPLGVPQYATGSLPTASSHKGRIVYDSTTNEFKGSDGTSWNVLG
jgi:hypothetical protein